MKRRGQQLKGNAAANGQVAQQPTGENGPDSATIRLSKMIEMVQLSRLVPAVINDKVYEPVDIKDPSIIALGRDIAEKDLLEPIVATLDNVIVSGHRRRAACQLGPPDSVRASPRPSARCSTPRSRSLTSTGTTGPSPQV